MEDGVYQRGLSFQDHAAGHIESHTLFSGRKKCPPSWAINMRELRLLLARYLELRAQLKYPRVDEPDRRAVYATRKIFAAIPRKKEALDRLVAERMAIIETDPPRAKALEGQIRSLDATICVDQRGPAVVVGIIHYYFRCGFDSVDTAAALKNIISPMGVRQVAHRLEKLWELMQSGKDKKSLPNEVKNAEKRAKYHLGYKEIQNARLKAKRANRTPEELEKIRAYAREYWRKNGARIIAQRKANTKIREKALEKYHAASKTERAERKRKSREYYWSHLEQRRKTARDGYHRRRAAMTEEQRLERNRRSREYCRAHPEQRRAIYQRRKAKAATACG